MRQRLLQKAPGMRDVPAASGQCENISVSGVRCRRLLEGDDAHEHYCAVGGGTLQRHNRVEAWLASRMREYWCCPVREEYRTSEDILGRPGRMDITARRPEGVLEVDVTVATVASVDQAELLRVVREDELVGGENYDGKGLLCGSEAEDGEEEGLHVLSQRDPLHIYVWSLCQ